MKRLNLDLDDVLETNHVSCQIKGLSLIQFRSQNLLISQTQLSSQTQLLIRPNSQVNSELQDDDNLEVDDES